MQIEDRPRLRTETRADGTMLIRQEAELGPFGRCMTERLMHWAEVSPDRVWLGERDGDDAWKTVTYAQGAAHVRAIGSALLERGISVERPLVILSGNSIEHALMALGAQHVGIASAALAPMYAISKGDPTKLRAVVEQLTPGMIFADHAEPFLPAISAVFDRDVPLVSLTGKASDRETLAYDDLLGTEPSAAMEAAFKAVGPDTVAKFLFTSGTTGSPKAVIQTQRLMCSNQAMVVEAYSFMKNEPPVVVDWAPWNHTASGNKVFNMVLNNGGSYYIDDGRPTPKLIGKTLRNLRDVSPTWYFNVPIGYQFLLDEMEADDSLADQFFARLKMLMYAGAGMSQSVWDRLTAIAAKKVAGGVPIVSGLGATESGPFALYYAEKKDRPGNVGIPARGVTLKLVPEGDKLEARIKSPSITPGYWRNPKLTAEAFDDEGYYQLGDALKFAEPGNPEAGFIFDGRLAENFKLATGTWVAVGALRAGLVNAFGGLVSDAVIAGENRDDLRALLLPDWAALQEAASVPDMPPVEMAADGRVTTVLAEKLLSHAANASGSASRVVAVALITEPLAFDKGEVTDKGSVNQRAVLRERAELVDALWSKDARVITASR